MLNLSYFIPVLTQFLILLDQNEFQNLDGKSILLFGYFNPYPQVSSLVTPVAPLINDFPNQKSLSPLLIS